MPRMCAHVILFKPPYFPHFIDDESERLPDLAKVKLGDGILLLLSRAFDLRYFHPLLHSSPAFMLTLPPGKVIPASALWCQTHQ